MASIEFIKKPDPGDDFSEPGAFKKWMTVAIATAVAFAVAGLLLIIAIEGCRDGLPGKGKGSKGAAEQEESKGPPPDLFNPVRAAPASFPPNSNMPTGKEVNTSGAIHLESFDPQKELIRFDDPRVWFESDQDTHDTEDDHLIHRAIEIPLKRLVNLIEKRGGKLKIQEAYREASDKRKIHLETSLHREGRALDLTSEVLGLGDLAKLCWQAGFDFVLYEVPSNGGRHLHCSVKRLTEEKQP
jgi:hypothetical protein